MPKIAHSRLNRNKKSSTQSSTPPRPKIEMRPIACVCPSPENDTIYKPVECNTAAFKEMVQSMKVNGVLDPIQIDVDGYIASGHRRYAAARAAGLTDIPVIVLPKKYSRLADPEGWVRLLTEFNADQRIKTLDELLREKVARVNPDDAIRAVMEYREQKSDLSDFSDAMIDLGDIKARKRISDAAELAVQAIIRVVRDREKFWPLSVRQIHYALLNDPPLMHARKPNSVYENNRKCYSFLTNLALRMRLTGRLPWKAISDETRQTINVTTFPEPSGYLQDELKKFAIGYYRNLQQSQPNHIEVVAEKLTVRSILSRVTKNYCIPLTIARGYASGEPRRLIAERFKLSGKQKLVLLVLSDFDPDGETICQTLAQSMLRDFGVSDLVPIKVALTQSQVEEYKLPPIMEAKASSSNYKKFVRKYGLHAHELEALPPETLQQILEDAIDSVLDVDAYNHEVEEEKKDFSRLDAIRKTVYEQLKGVTLE